VRVLFDAIEAIFESKRRLTDSIKLIDKAKVMKVATFIFDCFCKRLESRPFGE